MDTGDPAVSEANAFFRSPILNSPYERPSRHWELDEKGVPTEQILPGRRRARFQTPIPAPRKGKSAQRALELPDETGLSTEAQQYGMSDLLNEVRVSVDQWRALPDGADWGVTPETRRLLRHWRHHPFRNQRPFFCQVEAAEILIWLTEVAPGLSSFGTLRRDLAQSNAEANRGLPRLALKLATGAGKTTVMAMLIAWQTLNAVRRPEDKRFTRGFLVVAPGLTIRDRLQLLQPHHQESYYSTRELVPPDMLEHMGRAKIVITNYHAFRLRDELELSKGNRRLLGGRAGELGSRESPGKMLARVMPELLNLPGILVLNDEAHHCYRQKEASEAEVLSAEEKQEAERNREAARLWMSGLEAVGKRIRQVVDLSATPFFLRGSGYREGTLFPWTVSDFSLMDAIECGIVKLPRVPVADNDALAEVPVNRDLWNHIGKTMPRKGRGKSGALDPEQLPEKLCSALQTLYGHYEKTFHAWKTAGAGVEPCFIVVCQNTAHSKLVYDYISGYETPDGLWKPGALELFRNAAEDGTSLTRRTLLIDSEELESGEALDPKFREIAAPQIERYRRERAERGEHGEISDADLLREVMNTVGKPGKLGASIRCVVSVSMLTEGWDANVVTHVLGVRAFGTQLLCEQVIGRALRRASYELNSEGLFPVEYADIFGIPFDFTAKAVVAPPQPLREVIHVHAMPERAAFEIRFPRVLGYRAELPAAELRAEFTADSVLQLTPAMVGPTSTINEGIVGEAAVLTLDHLRGDKRDATIAFELTNRLIRTHWNDPARAFDPNLFPRLKPIVRRWLDGYLHCKGGTQTVQVLDPVNARRACEKITSAMLAPQPGGAPMVKVLLDPYNPEGSTRHVSFTTSKAERWTTRDRCHLNYLMLDSAWEAEFCRVAEFHPRVRAYVKNHNLGFEIPYLDGGESRMYRPDFLLLVDDGKEDCLHLVVEIKGERDERDKSKAEAVRSRWLPGVHADGRWGRWAWAEFTSVYEIEPEFEALIERQFAQMIETAGRV